MRKVICPIFLIVSVCFFTPILFAQGKAFDSIRIARQKITDSLLNALKFAKEDSNKVNILNQLVSAIQYKQPDGHEKALKYQSEALELSKKINYKKGESYVYLHILETNEVERMKYYLKGYELAKEIHDTVGISWYFETMGNYYFQKDWEKAIANFNESLRLRKKLNDKEGMAVIYIDLGLSYFYLKKYHESIKNNLAAIKICEEIGKYFERGQVYNNLANVYLAIYDYAEAIKCYYELAKSQGFDASSAGMIGNVYSRQENYPDAISAYTETLRYHEREKDTLAMASWLVTIADMYIKHAERLEKESASPDLIFPKLASARRNINSANDFQNNASTAIKYPERTRKFWRVRNYYLLGKTQLVEAKLLKKQNATSDLVLSKSDEAIKNFSSGYELAKSQVTLGPYIEVGQILALQASYLKSSQAQQKYKLAFDTIQKAISILQKEGRKERLQEAYLALVEIYQNINDLNVAQNYFKLYVASRDSIYNSESLKRLDQLQIQFAIDKAKAEEQLRQENERNQMLMAFSKREDSIRYQKQLVSMELKQQTLLTTQREQELKLKEASLELLNKQNELNRLNYLNSQAELESEQTRREEKEKELTITNQEKHLQSTQLSLQQAELNLKENQIQAERKQRFFYIAGLALLTLLFVFIYRNIRNKQRTERLVASERLRAEKSGAAHKMVELELQSLRAQLNPHFMFNSLNAIQELILKEDNDNSHLYLSRFSELLRMLLDNANQPFVSLRKEINLLEHYLSLENLRIPDLKYSIEIDPLIDSSKTAIPNMILQPYIENAIWHGLSHKKGERNLHIRIKRKEDLIICEVEDNGVGRKMSAELKSLYRKEHRSRGMELLSKRFNLLSKEYGSEIHTTVEDLHDNGTALGTKVAICIPYSLTEQNKPIYS